MAKTSSTIRSKGALIPGAIITGGSAGIGLATAKALYSEGVNVAMSTTGYAYAARNQERLDQAVADIQPVR
ncbi:SDR family NAD(P)-dependent oxidoreductase [Nostoc sp. XA010]|uniref:SDR family NAD(P)-dependent oxidoreductase n=1 Tax=Nostoc sp. XA010 TaxID=2780407 RepID=UPI001E3DAEDA|nr:SDR family NAD(P)-dependent oxidoreductase [Nostoc sp. XA010]MCC5658978.1 SDR family NAD(P)-dependent oxidoreductase [Nostoc sp. XA010]